VDRRQFLRNVGFAALAAVAVPVIAIAGAEESTFRIPDKRSKTLGFPIKTSGTRFYPAETEMQRQQREIIAKMTEGFNNYFRTGSIDG